jgi:hypothetical protein
MWSSLQSPTSINDFSSHEESLPFLPSKKSPLSEVFTLLVLDGLIDNGDFDNLDNIYLNKFEKKNKKSS